MGIDSRKVRIGMICIGMMEATSPSGFIRSQRHLTIATLRLRVQRIGYCIILVELGQKWSNRGMAVG